MSKPASPADFGTIISGLAPTATTGSSTEPGRFKDVHAKATDKMPTVKVGQVYEDLDPRCAGRRVQILKVGGDGRVMVRTVSPRTCAPRTASETKRDTIGDISFISQRRFTENTRGFRLLRGTPLRGVQSYLLAARLADACDLSITEAEVRACDALIGLLGKGDAHAYMDLLCGFDGEAARAIYAEDGIAALLTDAALWAEEQKLIDGWASLHLGTRAAARKAAHHA